jgi:hypothetical protein
VANAFFRVDTTKLVRGAARLMYAPIGTAKPAKIADVISITGGTPTYNAAIGWEDFGATREGIQITLNNTETAFEVDQVSGNIGTAPDTWECFVAAQLAEQTLENMIIVWEGAAITTDVTMTPNERETGFAGATSYTQRRLAIMFQRPNLKVTGYFFHIAVRAPQEGTLNFQKGGDAQTIQARFGMLADATETDPLKAFFRVREQV